MLDQSTAMRVFEGILRFARRGSADLGTLQEDRIPQSPAGDYPHCIIQVITDCPRRTPEAGQERRPTALRSHRGSHAPL
jgi:hypothetical protein